MAGPDDGRARAIQRLWMRRVFRFHAASFIAGSLLMLTVWLPTGGGYFWPFWPITGWGTGLAFHAWITFGTWRISEAAIRREIQKEADVSPRYAGFGSPPLGPR